MNEDYLYKDEKYKKIVELLKKLESSLMYTAPEAKEHKYYLLAEKYSMYFTFEEDVDYILVEDTTKKITHEKVKEEMYKFLDRLLEEEEWPIVDAGEPRSEAAIEAECVGFLANLVLVGFPFNAEGRIGEHVIERLAGEAVLREAAAENDVVDVVALDEQVGAAHGVRLGVVVLAEDFEAGVRVELAAL